MKRWISQIYGVVLWTFPNQLKCDARRQTLREIWNVDFNQKPVQYSKHTLFFRFSENWFDRLKWLLCPITQFKSHITNFKEEKLIVFSLVHQSENVSNVREIYRKTSIDIGFEFDSAVYSRMANSFHRNRVSSSVLDDSMLFSSLILPFHMQLNWMKTIHWGQLFGKTFWILIQSLRRKNHISL